MLLALFWTRETIKMHKKAAVGPIIYAFHSKRHSGSVAGAEPPAGWVAKDTAREPEAY